MFFRKFRNFPKVRKWQIWGAYIQYIVANTSLSVEHEYIFRMRTYLRTLKSVRTRTYLSSAAGRARGVPCLAPDTHTFAFANMVVFGTHARGRQAFSYSTECSYRHNIYKICKIYRIYKISKIRITENYI